MSNDGFPVLNDDVAIENNISKKRKYDPESYKRNIIKCSILKGKAYTNHKGNFVNEKRPKLSCGQLNKYDRLFTPYEVVEQIVKSSIPGNFLVKKVNCDEILDFKNWWGKHYKLRTVSDETKNLKRKSRVCFGISKLYHFVYRSDLKGYITAYSTINGLDKQTFFMSAQSGTPSAPTRLAYPGGKIPLKEAKANDIKKALQYVPVEHLEFYNEIVNGPIGTADEEDLSTRG
ncbi:hypothetical protein J6590_013802 [Homalodisca vitripennis]|nr:hypothetical protein J6590_013802 [Homalodisca vitripennis]